jgi:hypothetical protein
MTFNAGQKAKLGQPLMLTHYAEGMELFAQLSPNMALDRIQVYIATETIEFNAGLHQLSPHATGFGVWHVSQS